MQWKHKARGHLTGPSYHLMANNRETFATFIKTGQAVSTQALKAVIDVLEKIVFSKKILVSKTVQSLSTEFFHTVHGKYCYLRIQGEDPI